MMPDFPSAAGTLSSWRERRREGWKRGRGEGRQLERLPTAGNQLPVTERLHGSGSGEEEKEEEGKREEGEKGKIYSAGGETRCQLVCFLRLAGSGRGQQQGGDGWISSSPLSCSVVCHY